MLADVAGRDYHFCVGYVVIRQEYHLQQILSGVVVIDYFSHLIDQSNDPFGVQIGRSCLATKHHDTWNHMLAIFGSQISDG